VGDIVNVDWFRDGQLISDGGGYSQSAAITLAIDIDSDAFEGVYTFQLTGNSGLMIETGPIVVGVRSPEYPLVT